MIDKAVNLKENAYVLLMLEILKLITAETKNYEILDSMYQEMENTFKNFVGLESSQAARLSQIV